MESRRDSDNTSQWRRHRCKNYWDHTGEISRTVYFELDDLSSIMGVNATSVYLQLPDGVVVDSQLGQISTGVVERQTLLNGIESLIEQQTQIFQSIILRTTIYYSCNAQYNDHECRRKRFRISNFKGSWCLDN